MAVKTVDSKGRVTLGKQFANRLVVVDDTDPDRLVIMPATAVPDRELWLHKNKKARAAVFRGIDQARAGQLSDTPPDLDADAALLDELEE